LTEINGAPIYCNFLRMKLGESLERRGVAPHIFESAEDAQSNLRRLELAATP